MNALGWDANIGPVVVSGPHIIQLHIFLNKGLKTNYIITIYIITIIIVNIVKVSITKERDSELQSHWFLIKTQFVCSVITALYM